ncbi:Hypothetical predicted protein [Mytilus galloprovincialis]|uniref:Integrase catalytic domain-containing protein n=1 Tax=Mytilus galloprovincialis TaxID=29158 RepID=A0A8B6C3J4_MYTGA|nr:Hypothetical predicted protein [Mytilus galloprovincialis]
MVPFLPARNTSQKERPFCKTTCMSTSILKSYHEIGHFGFDRTYLAIKNKYFFPGMYQAVADYIRGCDACQRAKPHVHAKRVPLTPMPITDTFARWHIDLIGPFKETKLGYRHILIVVCAFSKWTEAFPVRSGTAAEIADVLHKEVFSRYGSPTSLVSDRGQGFMSKLVAAVTQIYNVKHYFTSSYHPQTNSVAERTNKTVIQCLGTIVDENQSNWAELLPDHRPDQNAPPPDVPRPDPRREEQPNFKNPVPPLNPNNDEIVPNQDVDISDTDEPADDGSKQF